MIVDGLRPFWLPTIAEIDGNPTSRLNEWVGDGQYYFDAPVDASTAAFVLTPGSSLLPTFAAEMSRFGAAAIETSAGVSQSPTPKSTAWLFIQTYYAAFYAAHSLLRSFGISATNFRSSQCQKADLIAAALGFSTAPLNNAQFRCEYLSSSSRLACTKAHGSGIHEQFWRIFDGFLVNTLPRILKNPALASQDAQDIFLKLTELRAILRSANHSGGNWLSTVRNEVTYSQQHAAWFPYGRSKGECLHLFKLQEVWRNEPDTIVLSPPKANEAEQFILACGFLVSLSVANAREMALRSPSNRSFLRGSLLKLLNQLSA